MKSGCGDAFKRRNYTTVKYHIIKYVFLEKKNWLAEYSNCSKSKDKDNGSQSFWF